MISQYSGISPKGDLILLKRLGDKLAGKSFLHVNSTKEGGGVAEILHRMMPILDELGIKARWEVIEGDEQFFDVTKKIHNALQGNQEKITKKMWQHHFEVNKKNVDIMQLDDVDAALIHDPQPAPLIEFKKSGRWIWRCHIDVSNPMKEVCNNLFRYCRKYDAAIFSVARFARAMGIDEFIIPPSIDPISEKNIELSNTEIHETLKTFGIPDRPMVLQVSRFDRFKDPTGVIKAFRIARKYNDCILILAGSPATDDPEGELVLNEVKEYVSGDPDIHILLLPPFSDRQINALQRAATVVLQKSLKEGFGLTVAEAMWKGKPVIGGAVGGIPLQIVHGITGFLVHSIEGAAFRIRQFLNNPEMSKRMGERGKEHIRQHFLITRQIRDYLSIWYALDNGGKSKLDLSI